MSYSHLLTHSPPVMFSFTGYQMDTQITPSPSRGVVCVALLGLREVWWVRV